MGISGECKYHDGGAGCFPQPGDISLLRGLVPCSSLSSRQCTAPGYDTAKANLTPSTAPRQWFCSSLFHSTGRGFTPPHIPRSSASARLWERKWCRRCAGAMHTIHEGATPHTNTLSLSRCCKVRIFYFTWPISLFPLEAFHFLERVRMSFVPLEEERRPNEFKVMTVIQKKKF